jgi:L-lactate transport
MWQQTYTPVGGSLAYSALVAAFPIAVLLITLGVLRLAAWKSALLGLAAATATALLASHMPFSTLVGAVGYGAAFGLFPIAWIIFWTILLYRLTVETGDFEVIKRSIGRLTRDARLQALLVAFAFGAFIEGAAGFGTPVALASSMLAGLGFAPEYAAGLCLLANTVPVAFGSLGVPQITLTAVTGLPIRDLSANVGRICAPLSLFIPSYLIVVLGGWRALYSVLPATVLCGVVFAGVQFSISTLLGPYLTDILASLATMLCLAGLFTVWKPKDSESFALAQADAHPPGREIARAALPYLVLVALILLWGWDTTKRWLERGTMAFAWPGLHNHVLRMPPVVAKASPYAATYTFNLLSGAGTACMFAALAAVVLMKMPASQAWRVTAGTFRQLSLPILTIVAVLALAFVMNYSGATATLGLAFTATGRVFPFFSALLGWLGVFLTGSDTAANALFGNLQVVSASKLGLNPALMAASNSSGGVMGKMISLQSIAVAVAATGMRRKDEARLFRFTLRHSVGLAAVIGLIVMFYAYVMPQWVR